MIRESIFDKARCVQCAIASVYRFHYYTITFGYALVYIY